MSSKGRTRKHMKVEYENEADSDGSGSGGGTDKDTPKYSKSRSKKKIVSPLDQDQDQGSSSAAATTSNGKRKKVTNDNDPEPNNSKEELNLDKTAEAEGAKNSPENWYKVYENIKEMRKGNDAPVDTMGCERTMDPNCDEKTKRYQTLISLMLSSQTKDPVTFAAMERLKAHGLTPQNIMKTDDSTLQSLIYPVGFYKRKVEYIKKTTKILIDEYDSDIPDAIQGLLKLPGVGPKMGYICLNVAWGKNHGIGVDTHVHRICERMGWVKQKKGKQNTPEDTRKGLEGWLPQDLWQEVNILLVGFGQTVCLPVKPKCDECLNKSICPFPRSSKKSKAK